MTLPTFETERLILRQIVEDDADGLHRAFGSEEAMRFWNFPASSDVGETASCIRLSLAVDPQWHGVWAIVSRTDGFAGKSITTIVSHGIDGWS
jgi:RimJ/RimL family protein N-acetyltransferase